MRNFLKNEKGKGRLQNLKTKLLVRKRTSTNDVKMNPKEEINSNSSKITPTPDLEKTNIREFLRKSLLDRFINNKHSPEVNNKISVIRNTSEIQLWSNPMKMAFSV